MLLTRGLSLLLLLGLGSSVTPARAASPREQTRALMRQGNTLLRRGSCAEALQIFERAKELSPQSYKLEWNLSTALECLGRLAEAAEHLARFRAQADPSAERQVLQEVESKLAGLERQVARVSVSSSLHPAKVIVDEIEKGSTPLPRPLYLEPGRRQLTVEPPGQAPFRTTLELRAGEERTVTIPALTSPKRIKARRERLPDDLFAVSKGPVRRPAKAKSSSTPYYKQWWFWTVIGAATAGLTVGAVYGLRGGGSDRLPSGECGEPCHIRFDTP